MVQPDLSLQQHASNLLRAAYDPAKHSFIMPSVRTEVKCYLLLPTRAWDAWPGRSVACAWVHVRGLKEKRFERFFVRKDDATAVSTGSGWSLGNYINDDRTRIIDVRSQPVRRKPRDAVRNALHRALHGGGPSVR